jgi:phosphohistidine phosphatase
MQLILVRHAEAANIGQHGVTTDFDRPLTNTGHTTARNLTNRLKSLGVRADAVVSSPLLRARQTAEPLRELVHGGNQELILCEEMAPDTLKPKKVMKFLKEQNASTILAVGHLPDLPNITGWLLGTNGPSVAFDRGSAALIETQGKVEEGCGTLLWLVTPEWYV